MLPQNKKTDWNDILKQKGVTSLKESLKANRYKIPNQKQFERKAAEQLKLNNRPILSDLSKQMNQSIKHAAHNNPQNTRNLGGREREIV